jgi:HEAT repeat protein
MLIGDKVDIPTLTAAFKQADPAIRHEILGAIWEFSIRVPEVVEVVVLGLADKDSRVKTRAMRIAGSLRTIDDRVLALLIEALADKDDYVRSQSARTLKRIGGPAAKAAVPTLKRPE